MFNYVKVDFPDSAVGPQLVHTFTLHHHRYQHEIAILTFRDWAVSYDAVTTGSPINITITDGKGRREFKGYVHKVTPRTSPSQNITEVMAISASYVMKNQSQKIYKNMSADGVINQIAKKHRFNAFSIPHPRIYPQISQAGHSDWEMMVRLAKQCGYSLRTQNTEVYFQPVLEDYTNKRAEAPIFVRRDASHPDGSTLYSFTTDVSEHISYDGEVKAAVAVSGLDSVSKAPVSITQQLRPPKTKKISKSEFFDKFDTHVVASDPAVAKYEADAAEQRASFPYRAIATVIGDASIRPDLPVYLDGLQDYSGYWVVLGAEHIIEEQHRNIFMYTTKLYLGTDSLGSSTKWKDGQYISNPSTTPTRTIIPGVRQTNTPPKSSVFRTAPVISPQISGSFGQTKNRQTTKQNNRYSDSSKWVASGPTPDRITQPKATQQFFPNRLLSKATSL